MVLSYCLGVLFLAVGSVYFFRLASGLFGEDWKPALAGTFLFLLEPRLQWVSLSGMETTLFICLLLSTLFYFRQRDKVRTGVSAGLLLWTRPEALIFYVALALEWLYDTRIAAGKKGKRRSEAESPSPGWLAKPALIMAGFALLYAGFNLALSGTVFPNTLTAKIRYYSSGGEEFLPQLFTYMTGKHLGVLAFFFLIGMGSIVVNVVRRKSEPLLSGCFWMVGLVMAYKMYLPYLYHEGRYIMPVIPFFLLISLRGIIEMFRFVPRLVRLSTDGPRVLVARLLVLLLFCIQFGVASWEEREAYAADCRYISDRQVKAALWMRDHLPTDALVATHDIGAIGYYSDRKILDMVGLVSPQMIRQIGNLTGLKEQLVDRKVTHVAVLRSWFELDNQNPLFRTDERFPEVMEVFSFEKERTHFVPGAVPGLRLQAWNLLRSGRLRESERVVREAIRQDPLSSRSHCLLVTNLILAGRLEEAEARIQLALRLHPESPENRMARAELVFRRGDREKARSELEEIVRDKPDFAPAYFILAELHRAEGADSAKAMQYMKRYNEILNGAPDDSTAVTKRPL
jgi:tetratricopeptide (TPR) repeat protein